MVVLPGKAGVALQQVLRSDCSDPRSLARLQGNDHSTRLSSMVTRLLSAQHFLHPLHVYCRLLDLGINRKLAMFICRTYRILFFVSFNLSIKTLIHSCLLIDRSRTIQDELRK